MLFDAPATAEQEDHPSAAALREFLAADRFGMGFLPDTGWRLVHRGEREAQYIALFPDGQESGAGYLTFRSSGEGWSFAGGGGCTPQAMLDGQLPAIWTLAPGQLPLDSSATQFTALVSQTGCEEGDDRWRRIVPPAITYTDAAVFVVIAARPFHGISLCGGTNPTPFTVMLREPLGDRRLLDAGVYPPVDARR